eukprot:CAMPEP_0119390364 /NCGR_PEP_ID=MMETSP1334-20130426/113067_1 /TAXON_ID=127549 /ORGANISM="Calcidiscus leptoporus, Strain RCC1130" /LENGTH=54 /DNA_ID=CAMNT_0007412831 /DNA_START=35 /DNA_END=195 /DNA_ORIENTATION=-
MNASDDSHPLRALVLLLLLRVALSAGDSSSACSGCPPIKRALVADLLMGQDPMA